MKKALYGLSAIVIAIAAFAFTNVNKKVGELYWFPLNASTGAAQTLTSLPTYQVSDPTGCTIGANYCEGGYTSYSVSNGVYSPAGSEDAIDKKN